MVESSEKEHLVLVKDKTEELAEMMGHKKIGEVYNDKWMDEWDGPKKPYDWKDNLVWNENEEMEEERRSKNRLCCFPKKTAVLY